MKICEATTTYKTTGTIPFKELDMSYKIPSYMKGCFHPFKESVWIIVLNVANVPICREKLSEGTLTASIVSIRDTFKAILKHEGASNFILVHNHPSGKTEPSKADDELTKSLKEASKVMQIGFLDHCIIGDEDHGDYYSYADGNPSFNFWE